METISVAITGSSDMRYLDLYLINIFTKSRKAERCTDVKFKLAFYCLSVTVKDMNILGTRSFILDATSGTR